MVGVPGKSEGCNTCRRRKVKCDAEKPFCKRCQNSNRQCEGYEKYPVFMITTQHGLQKRQRLEEVKPLSAIHGIQFPTLNNKPVGLTAKTGRVSPQTPSSTSVWISQIAGMFWSSCISPDPRFNTGPGLIWMREALQLPDPSQALKRSLIALCTTRVAWLNGDTQLAMQGRQIYGEALRSIQTALYDPMLMLDDHTFCAARTLMLYEFFESTSNDPSGWKRHIDGLAMIVRARGPTGYRSLLGRALFEDARDSMMIQALMERRSSFLSHPNWLKEPWSDAPKDHRQHVCDIGLVLASLLEELDNTVNGNTTPNRQHLGLLLSQCLELNDQIKQLDLEKVDAVNYGDVLHYHDIQSAIASMHALALRLVMPNLVFPIKMKLRLCERNDFGDNIPQLIKRVEDEFGDSVQLEVCRRIMASARFCKEDSGITGSRRIVFPLAAALYQLMGLKAPELSECKAMYAELTSKRGVGIAKQLGMGVSSRFDALNQKGPTGLFTGPS